MPDPKRTSPPTPPQRDMNKRAAAEDRRQRQREALDTKQADLKSEAAARRALKEKG